MKRFLVFVFIALLIGCGGVWASIGTPDVTTLSWLNVPVTCLDTVAGVQRIPDSAHVVVFFGNSPNAPAYVARNATAGAGAAWIDSVRYAGRTLYYFWDQIADIDADSGVGFYSGVVSLFTQGYPTDNYFSFNLVDTTAQEYGSLNYFNLIAHRDSVENAITATNKANFKATGSDLWDLDLSGEAYDGDSTKAGDYVRFPKDSTATLGEAADAFWGENDTTVIDTSKIGEWLISNTGGAGAGLTNEIDSILAVLYDRTNDSNFVRLIAHLLLHDSVTIDNSNAWDLSGGTDLSKEVDSLLAVLYDRTNDSNFVRLIAHLILHGEVSADMVKISGDSEAADSLEEACDGYDDTELSLFERVGAVKAKTDNLPTDPADDSDIDGQLSTINSYVDGIEAKTDNLPSDPADQSLLVTEIDANETKIDALDDNPWDNAKSDTASGMGDWFADWFNANHWLTSDGDTNTNPFDASSDKVTLVDTSAEDISYTKNHPDDFKATIPDSTRIYYADKQIIAHVVYETLYVHRTDFQGAGGDSIRLYFADKQILANLNYDTMYVHRDDFKGGAADSVYLYDAEFSVIAHVTYETLYVHREDFHSSGDTIGREASTFDPASDNVAVVDSVTDVACVDSVRKVYILDSLDQTVSASIDSDQVSRAVHYVSTSTYGDSTGSMGKALVDAASCNPSGSNTIIIRLKRDSDSTAIIGASVEVKTNATTYYIGDTDNDGKVQFSSDDDTLFVYPKTHPVTFTYPETLFIDGNEDTTYYGTPHSPSSPPTDTVCIVYGWVKRSGVGVEGAKVKMWLPQFPVTFHGIIIDAVNPVTVLTDSTGYFEFSDGWYPNSVLLPANTRYIFRVEWKGLKFEKKLEVPLQNSWEIELNLP